MCVVTVKVRMGVRTGTGAIRGHAGTEKSVSVAMTSARYGGPSL